MKKSDGYSSGQRSYRSATARLRDSSDIGLRQFFAKFDGFYEGDMIPFLALIVVGAVVIYCVKRNNPAFADDADAAMVPADAIANPTLFKRLLNA